MIRFLTLKLLDFLRKRGFEGRFSVLRIPGIPLPHSGSGFFLIKSKSKSEIIAQNEEWNRREECLIEERRGLGKGQLIEYQGEFKLTRFGLFPFWFCGCEVIAVYNLLKHLQRPKKLSELIGVFEKDGILLSGEFGTAPSAIYDYLSLIGLNVSISTNPKTFKNEAESSKAFILTFFNNKRNIFRQIHTVCVTRESTNTKRDYFVVHNGSRGMEEYENWDTMLGSIGDGEGRAGGLCMISVTTHGQKADRE
ncbi:MAG: hypothetical protein J6P05_05280 [Lachnospiraceae bacterium]|nr:hypothetical protein [Lachnospiraceae bacterium]